MKLLTLLCVALGGCYLNQYPVTQAVADPGVYAIHDSQAMGTAWQVADGFVVTAGHMCVDAEMLGETTLTVITKGGRRVQARPLQWEMSAGPQADVCVLAVPKGFGGAPLVLADRMPAVGTPDTVIGYPNGVRTVTHGKVAKDGTTADSDHGGSGSPVFTPAGVYGIVTQCRGDLCLLDVSDGSALTTLWELRSVLDDVGVSYDTTPDDPTQ